MDAFNRGTNISQVTNLKPSLDTGFLQNLLKLPHISQVSIQTKEKLTLDKFFRWNAFQVQLFQIIHIILELLQYKKD